MARRAVLAVVVAVLGAASSAGCVIGPPASADRRPTVVATTSAWGSILAQLGGNRVHVISLISNPNTDPHDYEPTPADARALSLARLVVENGVGYDPWAGRVLAASSDSHRIVLNVGELVGTPSDGNPHLWYSPSDVGALADAVTTALERIEPADRGYFEQRRTRFDQQALASYHSLVSEIRSHYAGVPIGASESIVAPLARALGLDLVTPADFLRAISEGIDPSADDKETADRQIRAHEIKVFVVNEQNSTPDVTALIDAAHAAGIPVVEVTETLTPVGASFEDWQVAQLERLRSALRQATGR